MIEVKAPHPYKLKTTQLSIFLAGSIDMGGAPDWQKEVAAQLADLDVLLLNPRRDDWDDSWTQSITDPQFKEQVTWELQAQEDADLIVFYFADGSKSPITLLEMGLAVGDNREAIIFCTDKFYRKGNVDVVAERYHYTVATTMKEFIDLIREAVS